MDNNEDRVVDSKYSVDPTTLSVGTTADSKNNQQMIDKINAVNGNIMRGYNENLKHPVSNSLNTPTNGLGSSPQPGQPSAQPGTSSGNTQANAQSSSRTSSGSNSINSRKNSFFNRNRSLGPSGITGAYRNSKSSKALREKREQSAMKSSNINGDVADKVLENQQKSNLLRRKGLASRIFDKLGTGKAKEKIDEVNDGGGGIHVTVKAMVTALAAIIGSILPLALIIIIAWFQIFSILDKLGISPDAAMDTSEKILTEKLESSDDEADFDEGLNQLSEEDISFTILDNKNSIYSIKLGGVNLLDAKEDKVAHVINETGFDYSSLTDLYPSASEYGDIEYSEIFFYKLYKLNEYYKSDDVCGKQILDLPLLMITLKQESDNMGTVFKSNLDLSTIGPAYEKYKANKDVSFISYLDESFSSYFAYDYDWSNYTYYAHSSIHDMEILAQHMVKVYNSGYCKYDEAGYKEFLKEFVEKKYFLSTDRGGGTSSGTKSSNYFQTYDLTEFQLVEIANLCGQEQGHSNPAGAAAEASLMANKFEISGGEYAKKYSTNGEALYHYVRGTGKAPKDWWWAKAPTHMSERKSTPEVIEAVRDVLVNGNRTLPKYVVSHDCYDCNNGEYCPSGVKGDICEVITNGVSYTKLEDMKDRSNYIPHVTRVKNVYGIDSKSYQGAIFYTFPSSAADPFSYKDPKLREKFGECHYDFNTKEFIDCVEFKDVFVEWLVKIANDDSHGYSQIDRARLVDFDCSSLVYYGLINNGFSTGQLGSYPFTTRTMRDILKNNGFTEIAVDSNGSNLQVGDILWTDGHTEVYIGNNMTVGAHAASNGLKEDGANGDQNGAEISVVSFATGNYWIYAYRYEK